MYLKSLSLGLSIILGLSPDFANAQITLQANYTQTAGCSFSAATPGTLTLSADWTTISTESAGGTRPSVLFSNVGPVVFTISTGAFAWTHNGNPTGASIATSFAVMDAASAGTALAGLGGSLHHQISYSNSGSRTFFLRASGTNPSIFYNAGTFMFRVPISCI